MALIKNEPQTQNNDLHTITTLLSLVLEKSSKIDDLEKTIKAIDFKPQTTVSLNRELLSNEIAENLKFKGVKINEKKTFVKKFIEDWEKHTIMLVLSIALFISILANWNYSRELTNFSKEKAIMEKSLTFYRNQTQENQPKTTKSKSKK